MSDALAHKMVAKLAAEMANEVYEASASKNGFYAKFPDRKEFINLCAPTLVQEARSILAKQLAEPGIPDSLKREIWEALQLDACVPQGDDRAKITLPINRSGKMVLPLPTLH